MPPTNSPVKHIPQSITQNIQSQIQNFNMYNKKTMLKFSELTRNKNNHRYLSKKIHKKNHNDLHTKTIINLSNKNLSTSTISTLAKGLNFIPSPKPTPYNQIYKSFLTYRKNMYNRYYFRHTGNTTKHPLKLPTKFTAPLPDNSKLKEYISNVYHDLKTEYNANIQPAIPNISKQELHSIHKLKTGNDLIVKPADKGGAIVIWPEDSYLAEAYRQLNNPNHYQKVPHDPTSQILAETKKLAYNLYKSNIIDNTTHKFLISDSHARTPHLYLLYRDNNCTLNPCALNNYMKNENTQHT